MEKIVFRNGVILVVLWDLFGGESVLWALGAAVVVGIAYWLLAPRLE